MRLTPADLDRILRTSDVTLVTDGAYTTAEPSPVAAALVQAGVRLTLPYPPSANVYWRMGRNRKTGRPMMVKSAAAKQYIKAVGLICRAAGVTPIDGDVVVSSLRVYRPQRSGDLDNRIKVTLDALESFAYRNDDQVVELHAYRDDDKDNPRVEIELEPTR